jgi:hypothetical protein
MNIVYNQIKEEKKKCLCCGKDIFVLPILEKDFCDSCYMTICKELFNKQNDKLTIKELRNKIKMLI